MKSYKLSLSKCTMFGCFVSVILDIFCMPLALKVAWNASVPRVTKNMLLEITYEDALLLRMALYCLTGAFACAVTIGFISDEKIDHFGSMVNDGFASIAKLAGAKQSMCEAHRPRLTMQNLGRGRLDEWCAPV